MTEINLTSDITKIYVGQIGVDIIVDLGTDISSATGCKLYVVKADGTEAIWAPSIYNTNYLKYTTIEGDLSVAGRYEVQPYYVNDPFSGRRSVATFNVAPNLSGTTPTATTDTVYLECTYNSGTDTWDLTTSNLTTTGNITGNMIGDLIGNVTGDLTGDITGDVTGNVTGDLTGNITGNVTGDLTGNIVGPTGRSATLVVAASDSSTLGKAQADYVCDGTADDVEIQAAIDELGGGGKVQLLDGTFTFSKTVKLCSHLTVSGQGKSTKLIGSYGAFVDGCIFTINGMDTATVYNAGEGIIIENLLIDSPGSNGIGIAHGKNIIIRNIFGEDINWHYIDIAGCYNVLVDNVISETTISVAAIQIDNLNELNAVKEFDGVGYIDANVDDTISDTVNISDCILAGSTTNTIGCIHLHREGGKNITINNVTIKGGANGIYSDENKTWSNVKIINTTLIGQTSKAIFMRKPFAGTNSKLIINNVDIEEIYNIGVAIEYWDDVEISNLNISGPFTNDPNVSRGISLYGCHRLNLTNIIVDGNSNLPYYGIYMDDTDYVTIGKCILKECMRGISFKNAPQKIDIARNIFIGCTTTFYEFSSPNPLYIHRIYDQHTDLLQDCLALSANHVVAAEDLSASSPITCSLSAQPDVPRTLSWALTHAQITEYTMAILGIDAKGNTITETVTEADGWSGETDNAFAVVTSITFTRDAGTGAGDTLDIGIADKLGLSNIIYATGDVFKVKEDNADYTNFTVDATYHTVSIDGVIGAANDYTIWYRTNLNIIG